MEKRRKRGRRRSVGGGGGTQRRRGTRWPPGGGLAGTCAGSVVGGVDPGQGGVGGDLQAGLTHGVQVAAICPETTRRYREAPPLCAPPPHTIKASYSNQLVNTPLLVY